jgi:hypothetical protein
MAADAMAGVRNETNAQLEILLLEIERRKMERAGREIRVAEARRAEKAEAACLESFRHWLWNYEWPFLVGEP